MTFHYTNKETGERKVFGSMVAISQHTTLNKHTLQYHFGRLKKVVYEDDTCVIEKTEIIRSKRINP